VTVVTDVMRAMENSDHEIDSVLQPDVANQQPKKTLVIFVLFVAKPSACP
jgi:hypothetical protein